MNFGALSDSGLLSIGFTPPTVTYDKMRQIQAGAAALDSDIATYVTRAAFKSAWTDWYTRWRQLYDKYQPDDPWGASAAKLAAAAYSDELAIEVEGWRKQLDGWYDAFRVEAPNVRPSGQPSPPLPGPKDDPSGGGRSGISWWTVGLTAGVIVIVGGLIYALYRAKKDVEKRHDAVVGLLPQLLPGPIGQAAYQANARDPAFAAPSVIINAGGSP